MSVARDLSVARKACSKELGSEQVAALHQPNHWADLATVIALPSLTVTLTILIGVVVHNPVLWVALFVLQGIVFQNYQFLVHDLFLHRKVGGRWHAVLGFIYLLPLLFPYTWFHYFHLQHHKYIGSERDTESYKQDLDHIWKRLIFLTFPGVKLVMSRRFKPAGVDDSAAALIVTPAQAKRIATEKALIRVYLLGLLVGAIFVPAIRYGYLLPFLLVSPMASTLRVLLEHGEANPDNLYHTGTYYRTGFLMRWAYLFEIGDCHVVHHLYPAIPYYRCKQAAEKLDPFFLRNGVVPRTLGQLLVGWFIQNQPHRFLWRLVPAEVATTRLVPAHKEPHSE